METKLGSTEYQKLGEALAYAFVEKGVPLNTSLQKVASELNLTPNQVTRVAEIANVETYLKLNKKQGGYIEFPLADSSIIKTAAKDTNYLEFNDDLKDYYNTPNTDITTDALIKEIFKLEKTSHVLPNENTELTDFLKYDKIKKAMELAEIQFEQASTKLAFLTDSIKKTIKQYLLAGESEAKVLGLVKHASDMSDLILKDFSTKPEQVFESQINKNSQLYKTASLLSDCVKEWVYAYNNLNKVANQIETVSPHNEKQLKKLAGNFVGPNAEKLIHDVTSRLDKHPFIATTMLLAPAAAYLFLVSDFKPKNSISPSNITFPQ